MINIVLAMESVLDALGRVHTAGDRGTPLAEAALALAVPAARRPHAARSMVAELRRDPAAAARRWDCTLGAVLVWRAVDAAERRGGSELVAAETGLRAMLAYVDVMPRHQYSDQVRVDVTRRAALIVLELQARTAVDAAERRPA